MEFTETWFLTNVSIAIRHYSVTLGGSSEHFTPNESLGAYKKYVTGIVVQEHGNYAANMVMKV